MRFKLGPTVIITVMITLLGIAAAVYFMLTPRNIRHSGEQSYPAQVLSPTSSNPVASSPSATPGPQPSGCPEIVSSTWKTYRNDKFGFAFSYPETWKITGEIGPGLPYQEPYLFDMVVAPTGNVINKAGHVSVINLSYADLIKQLPNLVGTWNHQEDFHSKNLKGVKFQVPYPGQMKQIDYDYALDVGDDHVIWVTFRSFDTPERLITPSFLDEIDKFMCTFSKVS